MYDADLDGSIPPDLELANYGFSEADLNKEFHLKGLLQAGFLSGESGPMKLGDIISRLQAVYTDKIGVEYMHIWDHEQVRTWPRRHGRATPAPAGSWQLLFISEELPPLEGPRWALVSTACWALREQQCQSRQAFELSM